MESNLQTKNHNLHTQSAHLFLNLTEGRSPSKPRGHPAPRPPKKTSFLIRVASATQLLFCFYGESCPHA